jgi:hypothetical protein
MKEKVRFFGLDVHAETIAVAVAEPDGEVRSLGTIPNRGESIRKIFGKRRTRVGAWDLADALSTQRFGIEIQNEVKCSIQARLILNRDSGVSRASQPFCNCAHRHITPPFS